MPCHLATASDTEGEAANGDDGTSFRFVPYYERAQRAGRQPVSYVVDGRTFLLSP